MFKKPIFKKLAKRTLATIFVAGVILVFPVATTSAATDSQQAIYQYLYDAADILSVLIGVVLIGSTIYAGIQYTSSAGDPGKVQKAKGRLASNVIVLILYIFSASILNFILPG